MTYTRFPGLFSRRGTDCNCYYSKKDFISKMYSMLSKDSDEKKPAIEIIDTHRAFPYYDETRDTIVIDTHFFDILHLVSTIILSGNIEDMDAIADRCAADYYVCKDEIYIAQYYADSFSKKRKAIEQMVEASSKEIEDYFSRSLMFVLCHEIGHALLAYDKNDGRFITFCNYFDEEYARITLTTKTILSVDLSPIKEDLDRIDRADYDETGASPMNRFMKMRKHVAQIDEVIQKGVGKISVPETKLLSQYEVVFLACEAYLKDGELKILDRDQYIEDCIIDGYALSKMLLLRINDEDLLSSMKGAAFAYYSCLLTMNLLTCVNACVMNYRSEGCKEDEYIWNRMRLERVMYHDILRQYAYYDIQGLTIYGEVSDFSAQLLGCYDLLYTRFCERMYLAIHPTEKTPYCSCVSDEYADIYKEVCALLSMNMAV